MAQRNGSARVFGVMQELQQLRNKVCMISEKNRELAKALTTTKQELTKARAAQNAVFSDKVVEWMEAHRKPVEVQHQAIQCNFEELDQGTYATVENTRLEPEPPLSPIRRGGSIRTPHSEPRVPSRVATNTMYESASATFACNKTTKAMTIKENEFTGESETTTATFSEDNGVVSTTDSSGSDHQYTRPPHVTSGSERTSSQAGVKRRLRQRDTSMSYVEPKLNTKLRRGDYYGLGKRTGQRSPKARMISGPRRAKSALVPARFGQQCSSNSFRSRRTSRPVKHISYAEPKLNTKLRQGDKFTFTT